MKKLFGSFLLAVSVSLGCAHGTTTEKMPVTKDLGAYHTASIAVTVTGKTDKPDVHKSQLSLAVEKAVKEKSLFQVVTENAELEIRVNLDNVDEGTSIAALGAQSDVTMGSSVELFDVKEGKGIGQFSVTGDSKRNTTTVNGQNVSGIQGKFALAHEAMADQIATYIASHKSGAAK